MIGIGLDAVEIPRFRRAIERHPGIVDRVFTANERADLSGRSDPVPGLAARFAAKEAAMKALGVGLGGFRLAEIEVERTPSGAPRLNAFGKASQLATDLGVVAFHCSLTHTESLAQAIVLAR